MGRWDKKAHDLENAAKEAERFIEKARAAIKRLEEDEMASIAGCRETAAAKRASMDLTHALVAVRK